jgi:hypothetical protein
VWHLCWKQAIALLLSRAPAVVLPLTSTAGSKHCPCLPCTYTGLLQLPDHIICAGLRHTRLAACFLWLSWMCCPAHDAATARWGPLLDMVSSGLQPLLGHSLIAGMCKIAHELDTMRTNDYRAYVTQMLQVRCSEQPLVCCCRCRLPMHLVYVPCDTCWDAWLVLAADCEDTLCSRDSRLQYVFLLQWVIYLCIAAQCRAVKLVTGLWQSATCCAQQSLHLRRTNVLLSVRPCSAPQLCWSASPACTWWCGWGC